jgi:hypothetical protein
MILDGRNRYLACCELDIEPRVEVFEGSFDDALQYSNELNSARRNLDKSQKAMVAAYTIEEYRTNGVAKYTIQQASKVFGVSERYIKRALTIIHQNETIANQVFEGNESIGRAEQRIQDLEAKDREKRFIEQDISGRQQDDNELSDTYSYLYSMEKKRLVDIIVKNGYIKKGH